MKMRMARKNNILTTPMNYTEDFEIMALTEGSDHFIRIGNSTRHFDLTGDFLIWEEADTVARILSKEVSNLQYVSIK